MADVIKIYDPIDAAKALRCTPRHVYNLLRTGRIPGRKIGGRWKILEDDLKDFVRGNTPVNMRPVELLDIVLDMAANATAAIDKSVKSEVTNEMKAALHQNRPLYRTRNIVDDHMKNDVDQLAGSDATKDDGTAV